MRTIKFRGWHKSQKKMYSAEEMSADQLTLLPIGNFINVSGQHTSLSTIYPVEEFIPLQYTNLRDKNGKEIYEGDIVRETSQDWPSGHFETVWSVENLMEFYHRLDPIVGFGRNELEVIGNIYQNPELIKGE